jgi:hypothetical protein
MGREQRLMYYSQNCDAMFGAAGANRLSVDFDAAGLAVAYAREAGRAAYHTCQLPRRSLPA